VGVHPAWTGADARRFYRFRPGRFPQRERGGGEGAGVRGSGKENAAPGGGGVSSQQAAVKLQGVTFMVSTRRPTVVLPCCIWIGTVTVPVLGKPPRVSVPPTVVPATAVRLVLP